jgi:hypothetical protein
MWRELVLWYRCLEETWQRGYSWNYRLFRLKEALGLLKDEDGEENA